MKSLIEILLIYFIIANFADGFSYQRVFRQSEVCGFHNGHRKYLELGDTGKLSATNITVPSVSKNHWFFANWIKSVIDLCFESLISIGDLTKNSLSELKSVSCAAQNQRIKS